jgi:hypothetical protein
MKKNMKLFNKVLEIIYQEHNGNLQLTFTEENSVEGCGEDFLNFRTYPEITCTFGGGMVEFDCAEPLPLEDCPMSFLESIVKVSKGMTEDEFWSWYERNCI